MPDYNYYPVEVDRSAGKPEKKTKKLSQFQIKLIAIIGLVLLMAASGIFYIADKILNPVLIKILVEPSLEYDYIYPIGEDLLIARIHGSLGIIDKSGEIVVPLIYEQIYDFYDDAAVVRKNGKWGLIDKTGEIITPIIYDRIGGFREGMAIVHQDDKCGYIDTKGNIIVDFIYDHAFDFSEGLAMVKLGDKLGAINKTGRVVLPFIYDSWNYVPGFIDGFMVISKPGVGNGVVDKTGKVIIPFEYNRIIYIQHLEEESYFQAETPDNKTSFISTSGEIIITLNNEEYDQINHLSEGLISVQKDGKYGFINTSGELVIDFAYDFATDFNNGVAEVTIGNRRDRIIGVIDTSGEEIIPLEYFRLGDITEEFITASKFMPDINGEINLKYGFINKYGDTLIPFIYDYAGWFRFQHGLAVAGINGKFGMIDKEANIVVHFMYDDFYFIDERIIKARKNRKWGLLNKKGEVILDFEYDEINEDHRDGGKLICVQKDGLWGIVEIRG